MRKSIISLVVMGLVFGVVAVLVGSALVVSARDTNSSTMMAESQPTQRTGRCDPMQQEQTDLSGTYTGKVNYPEASLSGDATLTITGNDFTLTAGSSTQTGRITAVTTCNYTGATMMFGDTKAPDPTKPPPPPLPAVSLRAKKMGTRMTLTSVPGETRSFSFGSAGARPRTTRRPRKTPPPPPPAPPE